jgi:hypothetical protein
MLRPKKMLRDLMVKNWFHDTLKCPEVEKPLMGLFITTTLKCGLSWPWAKSSVLVVLGLVGVGWSKGRTSSRLYLSFKFKVVFLI